MKQLPNDFKPIKIIKHLRFRASKSQSQRTITRYFAITKEDKMPNGTNSHTGYFITKTEADRFNCPIISDNILCYGT